VIDRGRHAGCGGDELGDRAPSPTSAPAAPSPWIISCALAGRRDAALGGEQQCFADTRATAQGSGEFASAHVRRGHVAHDRALRQADAPRDDAGVEPVGNAAWSEASVSSPTASSGRARASRRAALDRHRHAVFIPVAIVRWPLARPRRPGAIQRCWASISARSRRSRGR
jgi:hypothetical protein